MTTTDTMTQAADRLAYLVGAILASSPDTLTALVDTTIDGATYRGCADLIDGTLTVTNGDTSRTYSLR